VAEVLGPIELAWSREVLFLVSDGTPAVIVAYPRRQEDVPHRVGRIGDVLLVWWHLEYIYKTIGFAVPREVAVLAKWNMWLEEMPFPDHVPQESTKIVRFGCEGLS
jgi:hypothetical protein